MCGWVRHPIRAILRPDVCLSQWVGVIDGHETNTHSQVRCAFLPSPRRLIGGMAKDCVCSIEYRAGRDIALFLRSFVNYHKAGTRSRARVAGSYRRLKSAYQSSDGIGARGTSRLRSHWNRTIALPPLRLLAGSKGARRLGRGTEKRPTPSLGGRERSRRY